MLQELGIGSIEELFRDIPRKARMTRIGLGPSMDEEALVAHVRKLLSRNKPLEGYDSYLGGGIYPRYTPAVVDGILQRSEFYTSYTPYQPEASQGTLQALFEFQSLWVELSNMEVANASLYDGATALAEAVLMALRIHPGRRILIPSTLHWERRSVLENYAQGTGAEFVDIPFDAETGLLDLDFVRREAAKDVAAVVVEYPDSLGLLDERFTSLKSLIGNVPLVVYTDPLSLSLLEPPGSWGADIVAGEGQSFGLPASYGGPHVGVMSARLSAVRQLPGRLVGATQDANGKRAYVLTLGTREQHIRRSRATSNVCTNHSLMALAFVAYATTLGPRGLQKVARSHVDRVHALARGLQGSPHLRVPRFSAPYLFDLPIGVEGMSVKDFLAGMAARKILAGVPVDDPRSGRNRPPLNVFVASAGPEINDKAIARYAEAAGAIGGGK